MMSTPNKITAILGEQYDEELKNIEKSNWKCRSDVKIRNLLIITTKVWVKHKVIIQNGIKKTTEIYELKGYDDIKNLIKNLNGVPRYEHIGLLAHGSYDQKSKTAEFLGIRLSTTPNCVEPQIDKINKLLTVLRSAARLRLDIFTCDIGNGTVVRNIIKKADIILRYPKGITLSSDITGGKEGWKQDWCTIDGWRPHTKKGNPINIQEALTYFKETNLLNFQFQLGTAEQIVKLIKKIELYRYQSSLKRIKLSYSIAELIVYCETNDPLINQQSPINNPYTDRKNCNIL